MGPTEDNKQDASAAMPGAPAPMDGGAMPPAQGMPPMTGSDPAAMVGGAPAPNPDEVGMGDESAAAMPAAPVDSAPTMPSDPAAPAADAGAPAPEDPSAGMPGSAPQQ